MWNNPPTVRVPRPKISSSDADLLKVAPRAKPPEATAPTPRPNRLHLPIEIERIIQALDLARRTRRD